MAKTGKCDQRQLKNYLIRTDIQISIITANLVFLLAVLTVLLAVLLSPLYYDMLHSDELWVQRISGGLFLILLRRVSLAMLLILVLSVIHQVVLSHRFCGPLVNFGHTFDQMAKGVFTRKVNLRKGDFLKPEAEKINQVIDHLEEDRQNIVRIMDGMDKALAKIGTPTCDPQASPHVDDLKRSVDQCRRIVSAWLGPVAEEES